MENIVIPEKIKGYRSRVINAVIDATHQINPLSSESVGLEQFTNGTMFHVRKGLPAISSALEYHLQVEQSEAAKVKIHGGRTLIKSSAIALTVDSGTSASYDDVKTLTISASGFVCIDLDSSTTPTTATISNHAAYPSSTGDKSWPLAYVTWDTDHITDLEPIWTGGDISWPIRSMRYVEASGKLQYTFLLAPDTADWIDITTSVDCNGEGGTLVEKSFGSIQPSDKIWVRE